VRREIVTARSGEPTLLIDGVSVHSRYDPRREAMRYLDSLSGRIHRASVVIIVGEGLSYLSETLEDRFPRMKVLSIRVGPTGPGRLDREIDAVSAAPGLIRRWLRERISPLDAGGVELLLWEPARKPAPDVFRAAEDEVVLAVRDLQAQIATTGAFGRRWITNALRNAIAADVRWSFTRSDGADQPESVTIVTSGPSLERILPGTKPGGYPAAHAPEAGPFPGVVVATSSALTAPRHTGIDPDLVIHTDGGFWAARYLRDVPPVPGASPLLVAVPARSAIPYRLLHGNGPEGIAPVFLATGWIGDELHDDHHRWPRVSESPTVAGTMLSLARELAPAATFYVAGLDLCSRGLLGHARPHLNDRFMATSARRLQSEATQRARRLFRGDVRAVRWSDGVVGWQTSALEAFETVIASMVTAPDTPGRIVPLYPMGIHPPMWRDRSAGAGSGPAEGSQRSIPGMLPIEEVSRSSRRDRVRHIRTTLGRWKDALSAGEWDEKTRELAFHLAPVEALHARDGVSSFAGPAAIREVEILSALLERLHG
jgi:hypothetical protein